MKNTKRLHIKTWGCQMNVYDSDKMADILAPMGYEAQDIPDDADMVILNTCHIREKATEKLFSQLGRIKPLKDKKEAAGESMIIGVAGCVAQAEGALIQKRAPYVDMVFGPQTYHLLPEMVDKAQKHYGELRQVNTDFPTESKFDFLPTEHQTKSAEFVSIQEGCDKFCTFCVVPYTRGSEYSRDAAAILNDVKRLAASGTKEITLLGQNVNAYHGDGPDGKTWSLARLIYGVAEIDGIERIRYTTSHPRDMTDELIQAHAKVPQLMPYLHLPIQSGSSKILKAMNRKHEVDLYKEIIDKVYAARPDIAMSSDFIVGFPGETEEDFQGTLDIVEYTKYQSAYSFKYSPRPGTPGATMGAQVKEEVKAERLERLQALINHHQYEFNKKKVGMTLPVLFDRKGKTEGQLLGRTPYNQSIHMEAPARLHNQIVDVKITKGSPNSVVGEIVMVDGLSQAA